MEIWQFLWLWMPATDAVLLTKCPTLSARNHNDFHYSMLDIASIIYAHQHLEIMVVTYEVYNY